MLIGYVRPKQDDLNCKKQIDILLKMECETIVSEKHGSPKQRTQLKEMMNTLNEKDKIIVTSLATIADSTPHLVELLEKINLKNAFISSLKENIDTSYKSMYSFYEIVKNLAEFQSDVISEKTKIGLSVAKQKGVSTGRPRKPDQNVQRAIEMYQSKNFSLAQIKEETGISKSTLYRYLEN